MSTSLQREMFWKAASAEDTRQILEAVAMLLGGLASANLLMEATGQPGRTRFSRSELEVLLAPLRDPKAAADVFAAPADRRQAIEEHRELLRCDWSPVPLLDAIFGAKPTFFQRIFGKTPPEPPEWTEVDLSPGAIVDAFLRRVTPIIEEVERRIEKGGGGS